MFDFSEDESDEAEDEFHFGDDPGAYASPGAPTPGTTYARDPAALAKWKAFFAAHPAPTKRRAPPPPPAPAYHAAVPSGASSPSSAGSTIDPATLLSLAQQVPALASSAQSLLSSLASTSATVSADASMGGEYYDIPRHLQGSFGSDELCGIDISDDGDPFRREPMSVVAYEYAGPGGLDPFGLSEFGGDDDDGDTGCDTVIRG